MIGVNKEYSTDIYSHGYINQAEYYCRLFDTMYTEDHSCLDKSCYYGTILFPEEFT